MTSDTAARFDIWDADRRVLLWSSQTIADVAEAMEIAEEEAEWAIEEHGRVDGMDRKARCIIAVPAGNKPRRWTIG